MDFKREKIGTEAVTRKMRDLSDKTGNIYESVAVLARRSDQIGKMIKEELGQKIEEFSTPSDTLEEVFENREQIEIAKYYERLPKPTLIAMHEFMNDKVYHRNPVAEARKENK
jgi:DNA-directed RNA polymerase subunit K/omega